MQNQALPTPVSMAIIISCVLVFLFRNISPGLALWPLDSGHFQLWQPLTYAFLHGGFNHLFFNMFAVWMFGTPLENAWGSQRYANFYLACILGAAGAQILVQSITGEQYPTIGASGGVFGLLLAYGVMWPNNRLFLLFLPVAIKAKWFVLLYGLAELLFGLTGAMPGIAHFAHLGGMVIGAAVLWKWGWRPGMTWQK
jgi:membrane associated rhomboid family serine protease